MKIKLVAFILVTFVAATMGIIRISSRSNQDQLSELETAKERGSIRWKAQAAKLKGEQQIVLPGPIADYATSVNSIDEVLSHFGVIVAQPVDKKSYVYDADEIRTWYKFKILENLSEKQLPRCASCALPAGRLPQEMLPLNTQEILIETYGGTVDIDGINVTMFDRQIPEFLVSNKYLLFLSTDPSGNVGLLRMGPIGIFTIRPNDIVESVSKKPHPFTRDVRVRYQNSLDRLRADIQTRLPVR